MAADLSPEELARQAVTPAWTALSSTVNRSNELKAVATRDSLKFDAAGLTAVLQAFIALDRVNPIPDVAEALERGLV